MAATFGFSAGDFVAGMQLLQKCVLALHDTKGASAEYSSTILELEILQTILGKVQNLEASGASTDTIEKIHVLGHGCYIPINRFFQNIEEFKGDLSLSADKKPYMKKCARGFRKIHWAVLLREEVAELKAAISPQLAAISVCLNIASIEQQVVTAQTIREQQAALNDSNENFQRNALRLSAKIDGAHQQLDQILLKKDRVDTVLQSQITKATAAAIRETDLVMCSKLGTDLSHIRSLAEDHAKLLEQLVSRKLAPIASDYSASIQKDRPRKPMEIYIKYPNEEEFPEDVRALCEILQTGMNGLFHRILPFLPWICLIFRIISRIPAALSTLSDDDIVFVDAFGRKSFLPYAYFCDFPVFRARLCCQLESLSSQRKYYWVGFKITTLAPARNVIAGSNWAKLVRPRTRLQMVAILAEGKCSRCRYSNAYNLFSKDRTW